MEIYARELPWVDPGVGRMHWRAVITRVSLCRRGSSRRCENAQFVLKLAGKIELVGGGPSAVITDGAPKYLWIDGRRLLGARLNFDASGFVDVQFCETCGNRTDNVRSTYDRQHINPPPPITIKGGSLVGLDLFTTDLFAPTGFFGTDRLLGCANTTASRIWPFDQSSKARLRSPSTPINSAGNRRRGCARNRRRSTRSSTTTAWPGSRSVAIRRRR